MRLPKKQIVKQLEQLYIIGKMDGGSDATISTKEYHKQWIINHVYQKLRPLMIV